MFDKLLRSLLAPVPDPLDEPDARRALAALLVRLARTDNDYASVESETIDRVLASRYGLSAWEAQALRHEAEALEAQAPDTVRFTRAIKDAVPYEERRGVIAAAWAVVLADGSRSNEEDALMRLIASLLGVSDRDSNLARIEAARTA